MLENTPYADKAIMESMSAKEKNLKKAKASYSFISEEKLPPNCIECGLCETACL